MSEDFFRIEKLDPNNYHYWSIQARAILDHWKAINPGYGELEDMNARQNPSTVKL